MAGYVPKERIFPPVIIPPATGLGSTPPERPDSVIQTRPCLVIRIAHLNSHVLIGIVRDFESDLNESSLTWGLGPLGQIRLLEDCLGRSLDSVYEGGRIVESVVRCGRDGGWRQLCWLGQIRDDPNRKVIPQDRRCIAPHILHALDQHAAQMQVHREAVLALRKKWNIQDATSRADVPGWLPKPALELLLDSSTYRALPEVAAEPQPAAPRARR